MKEKSPALQSRSGEGVGGTQKDESEGKLSCTNEDPRAIGTILLDTTLKL